MWEQHCNAEVNADKWNETAVNLKQHNCSVISARCFFWMLIKSSQCKESSLLFPQSPQHYCNNAFPQRISQCGTQRYASQYLCQNHPVYCTGDYSVLLISVKLMGCAILTHVLFDFLFHRKDLILLWERLYLTFFVLENLLKPSVLIRRYTYNSSSVYMPLLEIWLKKNQISVFTVKFYCSGAVLHTLGYYSVVVCAENEYWSESVPGHCR